MEVVLRHGRYEIQQTPIGFCTLGVGVRAGRSESTTLQLALNGARRDGDCAPALLGGMCLQDERLHGRVAVLGASAESLLLAEPAGGRSARLGDLTPDPEAAAEDKEPESKHWLPVR